MKLRQIFALSVTLMGMIYLTDSASAKITELTDDEVGIVKKVSLGQSYSKDNIYAKMRSYFGEERVREICSLFDSVESFTKAVIVPEGTVYTEGEEYLEDENYVEDSEEHEINKLTVVCSHLVLLNENVSEENKKIFLVQLFNVTPELAQKIIDIKTEDVETEDIELTEKHPLVAYGALLEKLKTALLEESTERARREE